MIKRIERRVFKRYLYTVFIAMLSLNIEHLFCQQKLVYSGRAKDYTLGHASCGKTIGQSVNNGEELFFYGEKGVFGGTVRNKAHGRKLRVGNVVAFIG